MNFVFAISTHHPHTSGLPLVSGEERFRASPAASFLHSASYSAFRYSRENALVRPSSDASLLVDSPDDQPRHPTEGEVRFSVGVTRSCHFRPELARRRGREDR